MRDEAICEFKVWAFLKRNTKLLSHDEYRKGHVGYHCSNTRRLKAIRGYLVNIHNDKSGFSSDMAETNVVIVKNEPPEFLNMWDGFPEVYFDSHQLWTEAGVLEKTRATAEGLVIDSDWTIADGPYLFDRVDDSLSFRSYHTRVDERVIIPVLRPEYRSCKLIQFFKVSNNLNEEEFRNIFFQEYIPLCSTLNHLNGFITNLRDPDIDSAVRGYFPEEHWCFSADGRAQRQEFFDLWTGANELFFDTLENFVEARRNSPLLERILELESILFLSVWYVAVDENVIVVPNRQKSPNFYYR